MTIPTQPKPLAIFFAVVAGIAGMLSVGASLVVAAWFFHPLETLPADVKAMQQTMKGVEQNLALQSQTIQTLAKISEESQSLRRDFDKHSSKVDSTLRTHEYRLNDLDRRYEALKR